MKQGLVDYNDICFENMTLQMEMEALSNDALLDECNHMLSVMVDSDTMETILVNYFKNGKISSEERKLAEGFYILANGDLAWEV
jgi:hypothetical protein